MDAFKNLADLGKHKSVKSELYGNLEMPGFKGFPSKNGTMLTGRDNNLNPNQGVFEVKQALVRHKLSNGRAWNEYGKEMPFDPFDKSPHVKAPFPLSAPTGALGAKGKATNPEMITGFGMLPSYPEEDSVKAMLANPARHGRESVFYKEKEAPVREEPAYHGIYDAHREKYSAERLDRLAELGFSEEMIAHAIEEESKRDIIKALQNPGLMNEAHISSEIEKTYERWVTRRNAMKTGENALGIGGGGAVQNPGVTANDAFAAVAGVSLPPNKTGADRVRAELRREEARAARLKYFGGLSASSNGDGSIADVVTGMAARIGTGPGGESSFVEAGINAIVSSGRGGPGKPRGPRPPEVKERIGAAVAAAASRKKSEREQMAAEDKPQHRVVQKERRTIKDFFGPK